MKRKTSTSLVATFNSV